MRQRSLVFLSVVVSILLGGNLVRGAQPPSAEYQLKAAFVSKFPEFAEWPPSALNQRGTIELCIARPNPFGDALSELVAGETLRGRALVTREVADPQGIDTCQVLFLSGLSDDARRQWLARAAKRPVLTVGDDPDFLNDGGIVQLRIVDGRVRFEINVAASTRAGVRLSSQLLRLALNVRGGGL